MKWIMESAEKVIRDNYHLTPPACVADACQQYREDNDWLAHFLEECCKTGGGLQEKSGELYSAYRAFAARNNEFARSTTDFYKELTVRGFERRKKNNGNVILGIKLCQEDL